ncbi:MAG: GNAT family N-acetyltransferase [Patescibacteria group bacterium]
MEKVVRKAKLQDARQINKLVFGYAKNGKMLLRPLYYIAPRIRDFFVCVIGNEVVGCVGLRVWNMQWAEIMALAVSPEYEGDGIGSELIKACLEEARILGVKWVAMLTFNHNLAQKFGFQKTDNTDMFPESMFTEKTISVDKAYILKIKLQN